MKPHGETNSKRSAPSRAAANVCVTSGVVVVVLAAAIAATEATEATEAATATISSSYSSPIALCLWLCWFHSCRSAGGIHSALIRMNHTNVGVAVVAVGIAHSLARSHSRCRVVLSLYRSVLSQYLSARTLSARPLSLSVTSYMCVCVRRLLKQTFGPNPE